MFGVVEDPPGVFKCCYCFTWYGHGEVFSQVNMEHSVAIEPLLTLDPIMRAFCVCVVRFKRSRLTVLSSSKFTINCSGND